MPVPPLELHCRFGRSKSLWARHRRRYRPHATGCHCESEVRPQCWPPPHSWPEFTHVIPCAGPTWAAGKLALRAGFLAAGLIVVALSVVMDLRVRKAVWRQKCRSAKCQAQVSGRRIRVLLSFRHSQAV